MKLKFYGACCLVIIQLIISLEANAVRPSYKTQSDIEAEKMGSMTDIDAFTFTPRPVQNESTKAPVSANVNQFLWQASLNALKSIPIASIDEGRGSIITDWYNDTSTPNKVFKINIFITQDVINPSALDVRIFSQIAKKNKLISSGEEKELAANLEKEILIEARNLYIKSKSNN